MLTKRIAAGLTAFVITASAALLPLPESINGIFGNTAISAQAYSANGAVKMPSDFLTFNSSDQVFVNVVSATKNGLYYYTVENYKKLIKFYSFSNNSVTTLTSTSFKELTSPMIRARIFPVGLLSKNENDSV